MTVYIAVLKDEKQTIVIEFVPLLDSPTFEPFFTGIEIVSVTIQQRPQTWQEQRDAYQASPTLKSTPAEEYFQGEMFAESAGHSYKTVR